MSIGLAALCARTLGGGIGSDLYTIIMASSVLYELIGPGCAKLALYLSHSYTPAPKPEPRTAAGPELAPTSEPSPGRRKAPCQPAEGFLWFYQSGWTSYRRYSTLYGASSSSAYWSKLPYSRGTGRIRRFSSVWVPPYRIRLESKITV